MSNVTLPILFESEEILAYNKPAGLLVHGSGVRTQDTGSRTQEAGHAENTLADILLEKFPQLRDIGEPWNSSLPIDQFPRAGILHRLDKDTSGVILVAKTQEAFEKYKAKFQNHEMKKTYHAFIYGCPKKESDIIDAPIGRSSQDFRRWSAQAGARGKIREAQTEYKVLQSFQEKGETYALVELAPKTGRTHQLRVHLKYIHHPIVADTLYGGKRAKQKNNLGFERQALHARMIEFQDGEGQSISIEAPYPEDFEKAFAIIS